MVIETVAKISTAATRTSVDLSFNSAPLPNRWLTIGGQKDQSSLFISLQPYAASRLTAAMTRPKAPFLAFSLLSTAEYGCRSPSAFLRVFRRGCRSVYIDQPVTKWRIHGGSTSYSMKMAVSRMIYYRKLVEMFPNEPRLHRYWVRDSIAPRFFHSTMHDFFNASRLGDVALMERAWADIQEIASELPRRLRKRIRRVVPFVNLTYRGRFTGIARLLMRNAASQ